MEPEKRTLMNELLAKRAEFVAFVERRLRDRALAEDVVQEAFARAMSGAAPLRDPAAATAWFYQTLRHALVDHLRRTGARARAHQAAAHELEETVAPEAERPSACRCVTHLAGTLDPKLATAVQRVDVDGATIASYAEESGITANNARVRLHRARAALRAEVHSSCGRCADAECADCSCALSR